LNSAAPWPGPQVALERVLGIQRKLHKWAEDDQDRRFTDLHNLVCDPATLMVAWQRVRANRGSRSAGVDRQNVYDIERRVGVEQFLGGLREELRAGSFRPAQVRERVIPKRGGKLRRLGIATVRDRVVQAALKLVLEPIFEADFQPCSYGFRPGRRAQDAIAEVHHFATRSYEWVLEADIEACFDRIDHHALMCRVRGRIGDKRVLALIKAFLWAGILTEHGDLEDTVTGTPQGGILSPLLANIALSALDRQYLADWQEMSRYDGRRQYLQRTGHPTYRLVRYADDLVVCVKGTRPQAQALLDGLAERVEGIGLKLKPEKTGITHIDEGFVFLGQRFIRRPKGPKRYVYTLVCDEALASVMRKVKALTGRSTRNLSLADLLSALNPVLRGWAAYFRYAAAKRTLAYLGYYAWRRVVGWLRKKHPQRTWKQIRRRYFGKDQLQERGIVLYNPAAMRVERYRYRGARISTPWNEATVDPRGARFRRTSHDDPRFLEEVQQALA
jgi:RNA-directed DNA polymerase